MQRSCSENVVVVMVNCDAVAAVVAVAAAVVDVIMLRVLLLRLMFGLQLLFWYLL